jgi:small subunit ribosomal protein S17
MKVLKGIVKSLKTEKTAIVEIERRQQHPMYKKSVKKTNRIACHVEDIKLSLKDVVIIEPCRPISKTKRYKVIKKVVKK